MKYSKIKKKNKLNLNYKDTPYVVKNYTNTWIASKKWTFNYLKNIEGSNLEVNTVRGNAALGEGKITSISFISLAFISLAFTSVDSMLIFCFVIQFPIIINNYI